MVKKIVLFQIAATSVLLLGMGNRLHTEADLIREIHATNQMEIEAGKLAELKAQTQEVRNYGKLLVSEHTQADNELVSLARTKEIDLGLVTDGVAEIQKDRKELVEKLNLKNGMDFDRTFTSEMDSKHDNTIDKLERALKTFQGKDVANYISTQLPHLKRHREVAVSVERSLSGQSTSTLPK